MSLNWSRALMPAAVFSALMLPAQAQQQPPQPQPQAQNPFCPRLEAQLQAFDRGGGADGGRAEQVRKFEEATGNQQAELERQEAAARRAGCESNSFFVLFSGQSAQCTPLNDKIKQMRGNLDRIQADIERLRGGDQGQARAGQRRAIVVALAQNNCGQQYQAQLAATQPTARSGNFLESLFGSKPEPGFSPVEGEASPGAPLPSGTYRTLCVRTCDGFYYPISTATNPGRFAEDEKTCRQSCPASETMLFSHRNPGEDINQAVSVGGQQPYTALPTAFRYRTSLDQTCTCKRPGETWSQALKNVEDTTVEQGDIVVNDQKARQLSAPRVDAQGKPIRQDLRAQDPRASARPAAAPQAASLPPPAPADEKTAAPEAPSKPDPNRTVRAVGPTFIPGR